MTWCLVSWCLVSWCLVSWCLRSWCPVWWRRDSAGRLGNRPPVDRLRLGRLLVDPSAGCAQCCRGNVDRPAWPYQRRVGEPRAARFGSSPVGGPRLRPVVPATGDVLLDAPESVARLDPHHGVSPTGGFARFGGELQDGAGGDLVVRSDQVEVQLDDLAVAKWIPEVAGSNAPQGVATLHLIAGGRDCRPVRRFRGTRVTVAIKGAGRRPVPPTQLSTQVLGSDPRSGGRCG